MTAYTSSQTGNWSDSATWGGVGVPASGDTASIGAHTVTVDVNTTVGTSPNNNTTSVITGTANPTSKLIVGAGVTLTVLGNMTFPTNGTLQLNAGATLTFDNSASGGSPVYRIIAAATFNWSLNGTAGARCMVQAIVGQTCGFPLFWGTVTATFSDFRRISSFTSSSITGNFTFTDNTVDSCATLVPTVAIATPNVAFNRNVITNSTHATLSINFVSTIQPNPGVTREFSYNRITKYMSCNWKGFSFHHNYLDSMNQAGNGSYEGVAHHNLIIYRYISGGFQQAVRGSWHKNYLGAENPNPHGLSPFVTYGVNESFQGNVFEAHDADSGDAGDMFIQGAASVSGGNYITVRNNIVIPNYYPGNNVSSGVLLTLTGTALTPSADVYNNTCCIDLDVSASRGAILAIGEASGGAAGQISRFKNNIGWGRQPNEGFAAQQEPGSTVKDIITAGNADYNWLHNASAGDNLRGYDYRGTYQDLWAAGNAVAAGVDANQGSGDPGFYDSTRNIAKWNYERGYGAESYTEGLSTLEADIDKIDDLINYIFEGFRVTNAAARSGSAFGSAFGAATFYDAGRSLAKAAQVSGYLGDRYS
jgi:hypothetical protein